MSSCGPPSRTSAPSPPVMSPLPPATVRRLARPSPVIVTVCAPTSAAASTFSTSAPIRSFSPARRRRWRGRRARRPARRACRTTAVSMPSPPTIVSVPVFGPQRRRCRRRRAATSLPAKPSIVVVAGAAVDRVVAGAAGERVVAVAADDRSPGSSSRPRTRSPVVVDAVAVMRSLMSPASITALVTPVQVTTVAAPRVQPVTGDEVVVVAGVARRPCTVPGARSRRT